MQQAGSCRRRRHGWPGRRRTFSGPSPPVARPAYQHCRSPASGLAGRLACKQALGRSAWGAAGWLTTGATRPGAARRPLSSPPQSRKTAPASGTTCRVANLRAGKAQRQRAHLMTALAQQRCWQTVQPIGDGRRWLTQDRRVPNGYCMRLANRRFPCWAAYKWVFTRE